MVDLSFAQKKKHRITIRRILCSKSTIRDIKTESENERRTGSGTRKVLIRNNSCKVVVAEFIEHVITVKKLWFHLRQKHGLRNSRFEWSRYLLRHLLVICALQFSKTFLTISSAYIY